jgi:hypothetical protein
MSKQITRRPTKQVRRQERREEQLRREAERLRAARNRKIVLGSIIAAIVIIVAASVFYYVYNQNQGQNQNQTETVVNPSYPPVDNIYCDQLEQSAYHVHAHLTIYIDGKVVPVAQGVGIATTQQGQSVSCYYWLHTHDSTGVVHIESPAGRSFTLGNFFDIWGGQFQQLGYPSQLDLSSGWQAYVNGKPYNGDFHKIPLGAHTLITLAYNSPNVKPDTTYNWNGL